MVRYYVASNAFNNVKEIMESLTTAKKNVTRYFLYSFTECLATTRTTLDTLFNMSKKKHKYNTTLSH